MKVLHHAVSTLASLLLSAAPLLADTSLAESVARIVEGAKGKIEKTEDGRGLKLVDLAVPGAGPHDHRSVDPYDEAFFEQLGKEQSLESLNVISTKFNDDWIKHLANLTSLKSLRLINNGKLSDVGMEQLAGLKNLESFSFVGTQITGKAYEKFIGFTKLVRVSHRGSRIDDAGLKELCEHLPNLESISLAHAKFTDAGAVHFAKLTKLKGLEIGSNSATPQTIKNLQSLPLEYLQLGEGFDRSESIALIAGMKTLKRLTITNGASLVDDDLKALAAMSHLESLEISSLKLSDERLPLFKGFAFLKELRLKNVPAEWQPKIQALLPKLEVKF